MKARIIKLQSVYRGWHWRKIYRQLSAVVKKMEAAVATKNLEDLQAALGELEAFQVEVRGIATAQAVLERLKVEKRLLASVREWLAAIGDRVDVTLAEKGSGEGIIQDCNDHDFATPELNRISEVLAGSLKRFMARQRVEQAHEFLSETSIATLDEAISAAAAVGLTPENDVVLRTASEGLTKLRGEIAERERIRREMEEREKQRLAEEDRMRREAEESGKSEDLARLVAQAEAVQPLYDDGTIYEESEEESDETSDDDSDSESAEESTLPTAPLIPVPGLSLPPPISEDGGAPKLEGTATLPGIAALRGVSPRDRSNSTPRTSRSRATSSLSARVERMPTPRLVVEDFQESPEKAQVQEELQKALSIEPNPLAPGVSILNDGTFVYTDEAKNALVGVNKRAAVVRLPAVRCALCFVSKPSADKNSGRKLPGHLPGL